MRRILWCLPLLFFIAVSGCSTVSVNSDYDPSYNFSTIQTYGWGQSGIIDDELARNPFLKKRIIASIDSYMQDRGYRLVEFAQADVLIVLQAVVKEKMRVTDWGGPHGYYRDPWYDPWWGGSAYGSRVDVSYYQEGTLIIDIVDTSARSLIWRGLGTGIVGQYTSREKQQTAIDKYVREILDQFPPGFNKRSK